MQYALLIYGSQSGREASGPLDGPFVETKEHLAGLVVVEAADLDGALAIAQELQDTRIGGAIEVRPVFESAFRGA